MFKKSNDDLFPGNVLFVDFDAPANIFIFIISFCVSEENCTIKSLQLDRKFSQITAELIYIFLSRSQAIVRTEVNYFPSHAFCLLYCSNKCRIWWKKIWIPVPSRLQVWQHPRLLGQIYKTLCSSKKQPLLYWMTDLIQFHPVKRSVYCYVFVFETIAFVGVLELHFVTLGCFFLKELGTVTGQ